MYTWSLIHDLVWDRIALRVASASELHSPVSSHSISRRLHRLLHCDITQNSCSRWWQPICSCKENTVSQFMVLGLICKNQDRLQDQISATRSSSYRSRSWSKISQLWVMVGLIWDLIILLTMFMWFPILIDLCSISPPFVVRCPNLRSKFWRHWKFNDWNRSTLDLRCRHWQCWNYEGCLGIDRRKVYEHNCERYEMNQTGFVSSFEKRINLQRMIRSTSVFAALSIRKLKLEHQYRRHNHWWKVYEHNCERLCCYVFLKSCESSKAEWAMTRKQQEQRPWMQTLPQQAKAFEPFEELSFKKWKQRLFYC